MKAYQNIIMKTIFGSKLYGTDTIESDTDYKGIFMPTLNECILGNYPKTISSSTGNTNSKNSKADIDEELYSLQHFMHLGYKGEMIVLDMLHAPTNKLISNSKAWNLILENKKIFYSKNMHGYLGYIKKQIAKYSTKGNRLNDIITVLDCITNIKEDSKTNLNDIWNLLPILEHTNKIKIPQEIRWDFYEVCGKKYAGNIKISEFKKLMTQMKNSFGYRTKNAVKNKGVDWKAISHAFRALAQLEELLKTDNLVYPLKNANFIKALKSGHYDYNKDNIGELLEDKLKLISELLEISNWPKQVDISKINNLIVEIYKKEI